MPSQSPSETDLLTLARWCGQGFPSGSHAYSQGLEWALADGQLSGSGDLQAWLIDIVERGSGQIDAALMCCTRNAPDEQSIMQLAELASALCSGVERWRETLEQGRAFLDTLWSELYLTPQLMPHPVAFGQAARRLAIDDTTVAAQYLQSTVAALTSAAMRLIPLGQRDCQSILAALTGPILGAANRAAHTPLAEIGGCGLRAEMACARHESMRTRLFRS